MYKTYMWPEIRGEKTFRFQSDGPEVLKRMRQRKDFKEVALMWNPNGKVYRGTFYSPKEAKRTLGRITRSKVKKDPTGDGYMAVTGAIVAPNKKAEM